MVPIRHDGTFDFDCTAPCTTKQQLDRIESRPKCESCRGQQAWGIPSVHSCLLWHVPSSNSDAPRWSGTVCGNSSRRPVRQRQVLRTRQRPSFRADPPADPDVQSDRIRLLCPVFGIKAFVWRRVQNPGFREAARGGLSKPFRGSPMPLIATPECGGPTGSGGLKAVAKGQQDLRRMPDGTRGRNVHITTLFSLCLCVYQTGLCTKEGWV
jgi:hypothetical protein